MYRLINRRITGMFFVLFITLLITQCAVNPVTGKRELMLMSETEEIAMGEAADKDIVAMYGRYDDSQLQLYISRIGNEMVPRTHRPHLSCSFKVLDTPVVNAFAVPGGYVYFTRGILAYLNSEAEFAGVLGHELGHINARHSVKQYSQALLLNLGLGIGSALSEDFARYAGIAQAGAGLLFLRFSRDNEREADNLGVEYATKSGYDAYDMAKFFVTLNRMHPSTGGGLLDWFSTHPNPEDRIGAITKKTAKWQAKDPQITYRKNRDEFLSTVDNLVFGEDPRQGYTENGIFYHPTLDFQFPVPKDWQLVNLPTQVQMQSKAEDSAILFSLTGGNNPGTASQQFVQETKASVRSSHAIRVNSFTAQRIECDIPANQDTLRVLSYFIAKDGNVYTFHGLTSRPKFKTYESTFTGTMSQFSTIKDKRKMDVKPTRLKIKPAPITETLRLNLQKLGVTAEHLEEVALINGMTLEQKVDRNTRLKVLIK